MKTWGCNDWSRLNAEKNHGIELDREYENDIFNDLKFDKREHPTDPYLKVNGNSSLKLHF